VALTFVGLLTASPGRASAQDPPPPAPMPAGALGQGFGDTGQWVISGETFTQFNKVNNVGWDFQIRPAADYFIAPNVSVGGAIGFGMGNDDLKAFSVAGRAGFNFNFTEQLGVWGRAGVTYGYVSVAGASSSESFANFFLPINYHIVPHVFIGVGRPSTANAAANPSAGSSP
jgi:hypothetical protein